ncbi:ABC-three component system middle component 6 [Methylobacterium sp. WL6]|uniref:ABC-three component system middle component 6 n=1 Tax=Methylobacterium sp. WL6 TaxID=2603901 RepID=UPI0011C7A170|nr:ABC-three component system middle component 6 [Methylobacterium sp. WL6]TXN72554.1 hypothetical protein FV230_04310 [Methylobacterium sp. WL6]
MILPGKHLRPDRALLSVGGDILSVLSAPAPVSEIWERVLAERATRENASPLPFDWFVLAMSLLYAIKAVDLVDGLVVRAGP